MLSKKSWVKITMDFLFYMEKSPWESPHIFRCNADGVTNF